MNRKKTDYRRLEESSVQARRLLRQEELILEVTEAVTAALDRAEVTRTELARRLGKSKGFVSQILAGGRNLTLRTIADVADALGECVQVRLCDRKEWIEKALDAMEPEVWTWRLTDRPRFRVVEPPKVAAESPLKIEGVA
jgi:transcriptional regulator with XRE-family HTH domain